jgi:hypothetical protein
MFLMNECRRNKIETVTERFDCGALYIRITSVWCKERYNQETYDY